MLDPEGFISMIVKLNDFYIFATEKQAMKNTFAVFIYAVFFVIGVCAQTPTGNNLERALAKARSNRASLEELLATYRATDRESFEAASYLISAMADYHQQEGRIIHVDYLIDSVCMAADKHYYSLIKGTTAKQQETAPLHNQLKKESKQASLRFQNMHIAEPELDVQPLLDIEVIDGTFLKSHIDNAIALRKRSPRLSQMPFKIFCDAVLPYRALNSYPLVTNGAEAHAVFDKYLQADTATHINELGMRYRRAVWWLRHWQGQYPFDTMIGFREMFFTGMHDCVDIANYATTIYRACGIPAYTEFNIAYKLWAGRHFTTAIQGSDGKWYAHSPESELPTENKGFTGCLNIYRSHFAPRYDCPWALHLDAELIPPEFEDGGLEDVSANYIATSTLNLHVPDSVLNGRNLVYLASFQKSSGLIPVTWGIIDHTTHKAKFKNVVTNHIYFPVYVAKDGELRPFSNPFIFRDGQIRELPTPTGKQRKVILTRKFPRKPHLLQQAKATIGTFILGSNNKDFRTADTLAYITSLPDTRWEIVPLQQKKCYQFYRVQAPSKDPHLHLAEIQFLSKRTRAYSNTIDTVANVAHNPTYMRIIDEPLNKCRWKKEYDGNVQTAPDSWPHVTLKLSEPQYVDAVTYVVKHADNGIKRGDNYALYAWTDHGWNMMWTKQAEEDCIKDIQLEIGRMYWLSNITRGKEELPFYMNPQGDIVFPHQWILELESL